MHYLYLLDDFINDKYTKTLFELATNDNTEIEKKQLIFKLLNLTNNMNINNVKKNECSRFKSYDKIREFKKLQSEKGKCNDNIDQIVKFLIAQKSISKSNTLVTANNELTQLSSFRVDQNKVRKTSNMTYIDNLTVHNRFLQMKVFFILLLLCILEK